MSRELKRGFTKSHDSKSGNLEGKKRGQEEKRRVEEGQGSEKGMSR